MRVHCENIREIGHENPAKCMQTLEREIPQHIFLF